MTRAAKEVVGDKVQKAFVNTGNTKTDWWMTTPENGKVEISNNECFHYEVSMKCEMWKEIINGHPRWAKTSGNCLNKNFCRK